MKVSKAKSIENRELVLDTAAQLFREHGFDGIGVADLMKNAGLTVGGFYKSFGSKEDLIAESCERACTKSRNRWEEHIANPEIADPFKRIASSYLSDTSRDNLSKTCLFSTLGVEVPRREQVVKDVFSDSLESSIQVLSKVVPGENDEEKRANTIAIFSQWVGALVLSRIAEGNPLSDEILSVARKTANVT
jgi:TetR/AcrR family transcriptional repressor of nem operon